MPITNGYTSLATLKARLNIPQTSQSEDSALEAHINTASRWIDDYTGRRFYASTETRYYEPVSATMLLVNDLLTVTTLKTDDNADRTYETTWTAGRDYWLTPANAVADGQPYTQISVDAHNGLYMFPTGYRSVEIVGSFGYSANTARPASVEDACLLLCTRLYKRTDAPLGVAGSVETGILRLATDRDVLDLLWPYRLVRGIA